MSWFSHGDHGLRYCSLARTHDGYGEVAQDGGHTPNNGVTETCSLSLPFTFWYMTSWYDQLTPGKSSYPLHSITWPNCGLKFIGYRCHAFCYANRWTSVGWIAPCHHAMLTCSKRSRVVQKPINSNPGLKVNQIITVSSLQTFFFQLYSFSFVYRFWDY